MGSHESYSFEKTKQVIRNEHPHQEVKRVHFENKVAEMVTEEKDVPLFKEDGEDKEGGNNNNNAIINTESNITCVVNESSVNANGVPTINTNSDSDSNDGVETTRSSISHEDENKEILLKENNVKSEILKSQISIKDVHEDPAKQHKLPLKENNVKSETLKSQMSIEDNGEDSVKQLKGKTKMTLDELMASLTQITSPVITNDNHRNSNSNHTIPNNQQRRTPPAREIDLPRKELIIRKNRPNGKRESGRYSWGQSQLETLYEEVGQADDGTNAQCDGAEESKAAQRGRRMSGDYDNLIEENPSENATEGQDNDSDVTINHKEDPLVQKELRLRHGKLWLYKYNYLDFSRKVQIQNQQYIGYYKSSCSLDAYVNPTCKLPTIHNNRGYISQSFESYLNKSGMSPRVNHMSYGSTHNQHGFASPTSPTFHNVSNLTNASDEGYHSHPDSSTSPLSGGNARIETFHNGTFDFTDRRLSVSDTGECLFTTFKPPENSVPQHLSNSSSEMSIQDKSQSQRHINQNGSVGDTGGKTFTTLRETESENQQTFDTLEPLLHGSNEDVKSKTKSKDLLDPSVKENDMSNKKSVSEEKNNKTLKKKTSWKLNFKLCCGSGFKKKFFSSCLQVIFSFYQLKFDFVVGMKSE